MDYLLYPQEKAKLVQSGTLQRLRQGIMEGSEGSGVTDDPLWDTTKTCMYHHFGAIHLLRFLVFLLVNPTDEELLGSAGEQVAPSAKKKRKTEDTDQGGMDQSSHEGGRNVPSSSSSSKDEPISADVYGFALRILDLLDSPDYFPYLRS